MHKGHRTTSIRSQLVLFWLSKVNISDGLRLIFEGNHTHVWPIPRKASSMFFFSGCNPLQTILLQRNRQLEAPVVEKAQLRTNLCRVSHITVVQREM